MRVRGKSRLPSVQHLRGSRNPLRETRMAEDSEGYYQAHKEWQNRIRANGFAPVLEKENMSKNRRCDRHGGDFSERDEDWSEMSGTIHGRYENGAPDDRTERLDFCPTCTRLMLGIDKPEKPLGTRETLPERTMLGSAAYAYGAGPKPTPTPMQASQMLAGKKLIAVDPEEHDRYIAWLERENGMGYPAPPG